MKNSSSTEEILRPKVITSVTFLLLLLFPSITYTYCFFQTFVSNILLKKFHTNTCTCRFQNKCSVFRHLIKSQNQFRTWPLPSFLLNVFSPPIFPFLHRQNDRRLSKGDVKERSQRRRSKTRARLLIRSLNQI